jgi:hypothetical protein
MLAMVRCPQCDHFGVVSGDQVGRQLICSRCHYVSVINRYQHIEVRATPPKRAVNAESDD